MYQYSYSLNSGASPHLEDDSPSLGRLPSADSDEEIDPVEYEKQARERQRALLEQADLQRRQWQSWTPETKPIHQQVKPARVVRMDTMESKDGDEKGAEDGDCAFLDNDDIDDNFDESKRGDKLYMQFRNYSLSGYMDSKRFVSLCYDSFLIPFDVNEPDFALADAKATFEEVLSFFYDRALKICKEPILNNCVPYDVFVERIVPVVANKKKRSVSEIKSTISSAKPSNRRYWSEEDGPKQIVKPREHFGNHFSADEDDEKEGLEGKRA